MQQGCTSSIPTDFLYRHPWTLKLATDYGHHTAAAPQPTSRCLDSVLPLGPDRKGRESEADACATLPHLNPIHAPVIFITLHSSSAKSCGDGRVAKQQVRIHWEL